MDVTCPVMYHVFVQSYPIRKEIRFFHFCLLSQPEENFGFLCIIYHMHLSSHPVRVEITKLKTIYLRSFLRDKNLLTTIYISDFFPICYIRHVCATIIITTIINYSIFNLLI